MRELVDAVMAAARRVSPRLRATPDPGKRKGPSGDCLAGPETAGRLAYAVNELPQPQPPVAFGFLKLNPLPIIVVT